MKAVWASVAAMALAIGATNAIAQTKEVTIAHQDMIVPFRLVQAAGELEKQTGYKINWKMFGGGGDVIKAMASGEIPIGEVGSSPATAAAAQGLDVEVVWILDDINNAEQLVVSEKSGVKSVADLKGKKIATPFVSTSHYQLTYALDKAGLGGAAVQVINLRPPEIAAAWDRGDIDGAFVWDPVLAKMKLSGGKPILSSGDVAKMGAPTFDAVMVSKSWADQHKDFVMAFVAAMAKADATYHADPTKYVANGGDKTIAKVVGAKPEDIAPALAAYAFPSAADQASAKWLGGGKDGGVAKAMAATAIFLKSQGRIVEAPSNFAAFIDPEFAAAAAK